MSSPQLWHAWRALHTSDDLAMAAAIFTANRLVKTNYCRNTRRSFYEVKDLWIQEHQVFLTRGRIARVETQKCWGCDGGGSVVATFWYDEQNRFQQEEDECYRCDGTGIWSERTLYLHEFLIESMPFKFHSYTKPQRIDEERAEDCENYGTPFTEDEEKQLPLPLSGVLQMLRYVTFAGIPEPIRITQQIEGGVLI
jgi:hypothetical protein